jgi:hypothetical protein
MSPMRESSVISNRGAEPDASLDNNMFIEGEVFEVSAPKGLRREKRLMNLLKFKM